MIIFAGDDCRRAGGMELHARFLFRFFGRRETVWLATRKNRTLQVCREGTWQEVHTYETPEALLCALPEDAVLFFNDGWWVDFLARIRSIAPSSMLVMRSGGNECIKAPWPDGGTLLDRQQKWAEAVNESLDFLLANSVFTRRRMLSIGIDARKILVVRGGVDVCVARQMRMQRAAIRRSFYDRCGFPRAGRLLGCFCTRLVPFKGVAQAIRMMGAVLRSFSCDVVVVGDGSCAQDVQAAGLQELGPQHFFMCGELQHDEAMKWMAASDVFFQTSLLWKEASGDSADRELFIHTETMGRSMMEAIAIGTPVLATDVGGTRECFFEQEGIGILAAPEKLSEALATMLGRLQRQNMKLVRMEGHPPAAWDWRAIARLYRRWFEPVTGTGRASWRYGICCDVEDTVTFRSFSREENEAMLLEILNRAHRSIIVVNTAGDYDALLMHYPVLEKYLHDLVIIANGGKRIVFYGLEDLFWRTYVSRFSGASLKIQQSFEQLLHDFGIHVSSRKRIDPLYVNFKARNIKPAQLAGLRAWAADSGLEIVANEENVKLVSAYVNKGTALCYVRERYFRQARFFGMGNGILDEAFLSVCDTRVLVPPLTMTFPEAKRSLAGLLERENI